MTQLFLLSGAVRDDPAVDAWFLAGDDGAGDEGAGDGGQRALARQWFDRMRACGTDVDELLHDGHPTACVGDAAFGYVNAFGAHVNVGFFHGATLDDPAGLLEGSGKRMRHVKLRGGHPVDAPALELLIAAAYRDIRSRLEGQAGPRDA